MHQSGSEVILLNANDLPQTTAPYSCKLRTFRAYFPVPHMTRLYQSIFNFWTVLKKLLNDS